MRPAGDRMWQKRGRPAPYDRNVFVELVTACRRNGTGKLLHAVDETGRAAALAMFVHDGDTGYFLLGAVDPDRGPAGVDLLLIWRGIRFLQGRTKAIEFGDPIGRFFATGEAPGPSAHAKKGNGSGPLDATR